MKQGPVSISREAVLAQHPSHHVPRQIPAPHPSQNLIPANSLAMPPPEVISSERAQMRMPSQALLEPKHRSELQGVVLTLGGPASGLDP